MATAPSPRTSSPRRHAQSIWPLECKCKAGYCLAGACMQCRQCCKLHNSRLKIGKEQRAVGRPRKEDERTKAKPMVDDVERAVLFQPAAKNATDYTGLLMPMTSPKKGDAPALGKLLAFLGYDSETAAQLCKHLPSRNSRSSTEYWQHQDTDDAAHVSQLLATMRLYREILFSVATSVCGSEECAAASLETCAMWLKLDPSSSTHQAVARSCLQAIANAKKGSTERRLVRATLCGTFKLKDLDAFVEDMPNAKIGHTTYASSRQDFGRLLQGEQFPKLTLSRTKFNEETAARAVQYILAYENVAYLSWGTKKVQLNGISNDVPSILRKKPTTVIYDQYVKKYQENRVSRSSFFRLCSTLTNGEVQPRKCIDYVSGFLVYDTFDTLEKILVRVAPFAALALKPKLEIVQAWLKYSHGRAHEGVELTEVCPRHDVQFGLSTPSKETPIEPRRICCAQCRSLDRLFLHILGLVQAADVHSSTVGVIHDIQHKIQLFMGHRLRVVNQQREIAAMIENAKSECQTMGSTDLAVILIDFKMKAEPLYFRETTSNHFGKRGMSWHGVLIRSWEMHRESEDATPIIRESIVYYDQLPSVDNKQDKGAVLSLLEATVMALKRHMPLVKRVVFQSDNASCYQNTSIILMLPIIGHQSGICVQRYEHTDTQDGKSPMDGQCGQAQRKVRRFVKQGNNCVTPTQYVVAVGADGGLPGSAFVLADDFDIHKIAGVNTRDQLRKAQCTPRCRVFRQSNRRERPGSLQTCRCDRGPIPNDVHTCLENGTQ